MDSGRVSVLEKWCMFDALLTGLSKTFDLLIAKLNACKFSTVVITVQNYLLTHKKRTKINSDFSSWEEILFGVPQGFILGP